MTASNLIDDVAPHPGLPGHSQAAHPGVQQSDDFSVLLGSGASRRSLVSALGAHVGKVVSLRPQEPVSRVVAHGVVAGMQDADSVPCGLVEITQVDSMNDFPADPTGDLCLAVDPNLTSRVVRTGTQPGPAFVGTSPVDLSPVGALDVSVENASGFGIAVPIEPLVMPLAVVPTVRTSVAVSHEACAHASNGSMYSEED